MQTDMSFASVTRRSPTAAMLLVIFPALLQVAVSQPPPKFNCKLNASSPFSYVVKIIDTKIPSSEKGTIPVSFGSLIHPRAVLTSAWYYVREMKTGLDFERSGGYKRFTAVGQNIWDYKNTMGHLNPCYQDREVVQGIQHPKSQEKGERLYFDFIVLTIASPFETVSRKIHPFVTYGDAVDLLLQARHINIGRGKGSCAMPMPKEVTPKYWVFNDRIDVTAMRFHADCIEYLCEETKNNQRFDQCKRNFISRLNATMLCMIPGWTHHIPKETPPFPTSYAGVPLVCNESMVGILTQIKDRSDFTHFKQDILFVVTLLRVYPWLQATIINLQKRKVTTSQPQLTEYQVFTKPTALTKEDFGRADFFALPRGENIFPEEDLDVNPKSLAISLLHNPTSFFWKILIFSLNF